MSLRFLNESQTLQVSVSDTGMGILPEERDKLFCMFGRLESNSNLNPNGIGLGLNICKQIINAFDGDIWVDDTYVGPGACFTFNLKIEGFDCEET